jgi:hypothetical protein
MTGPAWLAALLAAVMLLIAAGSVLRLALWRLRGLAAEPEADALHVLMGVAMAGMLEPRISPVPDAAWRVVFGAAAAWFGWRAIRARGRKGQPGGMRSHPGSWQCAHPAPHSVECAAMVYMLVPARGAGHEPSMAMPGMTGAAPGANPAVALVLALFMLGYIVWTADRMTRQSRVRTAPAALRPHGRPEADGHQAARPTGGGSASTALATHAATWSKIAMSLAMGYMLLTML